MTVAIFFFSSVNVNRMKIPLCEPTTIVKTPLYGVTQRRREFQSEESKSVTCSGERNWNPFSAVMTARSIPFPLAASL